MLMLENTWFSVISPEGCASILYHDAKKAEVAAESLKPTPKDLVELGICDRIIKEPNGGAHRDFEASASELKKVLLEELDLVSNNDPSDFLENRVRKYDKLGYYQETA